MSIKINEALRAFFGESADTLITESYGNGHINDTLLVSGGERRYVLQHMNSRVFPAPERLMGNVLSVTEHLRKKAVERGVAPSSATLEVITTLDGRSVFTDSDGESWRTYAYIENTISYDRADSPDAFRACAAEFGRFSGYLADFPADTLFETIKDFHNTPKRLEALKRAVSTDKVGRVAECAAEIAFALEREEFCSTLERARESGELPLRVTHNDTKLNNVLFDKESGQPVCVVDLDTVMQGYSVNDFGDAIRFGANTAAEDETDLSKVSLDLELFEAFATGYIEGTEGALVESELALLPIGAMMMTFECGIRFLTDYLEGDVYFKIHREGHNLDRARCQLALVADMESKLDEMNAIIKRIS